MKEMTGDKIMVNAIEGKGEGLDERDMETRDDALGKQTGLTGDEIQGEVARSVFRRRRSQWFDDAPRETVRACCGTQRGNFEGEDDMAGASLLVQNIGDEDRSGSSVLRQIAAQ